MTAARQWWHAPAKASPRRLASRLSSSLGLTGGFVGHGRARLPRHLRLAVVSSGRCPRGGATRRWPAGSGPAEPGGRARRVAGAVHGSPASAHGTAHRACNADWGRSWPRARCSTSGESGSRCGRSSCSTRTTRPSPTSTSSALRSAVRVGLRPVRGYEKAADRVIALLNSQADLVSGLDPMVAAVRANGREPGRAARAAAAAVEGRGGCSSRAGGGVRAPVGHDGAQRGRRARAARPRVAA